LRRPRIGFVWDNLGPYHVARVAAVRAGMPQVETWAIEISAGTSTYEWDCPAREALQPHVATLIAERAAEEASASAVFRSFRGLLQKQRFDALFLPSYWPARSAALLLAARSMRRQAIMMNESHGGTEIHSAPRRLAKRLLLRLFHGALVAGAPQARHFRAMGMEPDRVFTGYGAVDNDHFARQAASARASATYHQDRLGLPSRYILNIGRMVAKKDLATLIRAYSVLRRDWCEEDGAFPCLVLVGSGEEEPALKALSLRESLPIAESADAMPAGPQRYGGVRFMGFRQVSELPNFYALADAFVLPSVKEEWGLVVNEAMACGLPVVVSSAAGCAEDLVSEGVNGFTFAPGDVGELAGKLRAILIDPASRERMGRNSTEIISRWGCDNFAAQAERVLQACGIPS
jgi:1,2-diacylglycerol 3-alpha-glucosyltransferase